MEETKKVYCINCVYSRVKNLDWICTFEESHIEYHPTKGKIIHYLFCDPINKNCDCKDYERETFLTLIKRLKHFLWNKRTQDNE